MGKKIERSKIYLIVFIIFVTFLAIPKTRQGLFKVFNGSEKELRLVSEFTADKEMKNADIYDKRIIEWKDKTLLYLDFNGFEVFKEEFKLEDPDILWGEDSLYVMDKSLGKISIINKLGELVQEIKLGSPFLKMQEKEGKILIFRKDKDDESIDIIDREGKILQSHLEKIPILTGDTNNRGDYLIASLDIDKDLKSIAAVYSNSGEELFTLDMKDEIIIYSRFIKNNLLVATDKSLYFIKNGQIKWDKNYENIKDIVLVDNEILILYDNVFEILNLKGKIKKERILDQSLENILVTDDEIFIWGKNNIVIPKRKKNKLNFTSQEDIVNIRYDDENLLLQKEGKIEIYELREKGDK